MILEVKKKKIFLRNFSTYLYFDYLFFAFFLFLSWFIAI